MLLSYFAQMLVAMQARITAKVPEIRWVDQDLGQLDLYEGERPPVAWPCVLVDFDDTNYDGLGLQVQDGMVNIGLRLAFPAYSQSSNTAPTSVKEAALKYYEIEMKLYAALQGWQPDSEICQPLTRVSAVSEKGREDNLRVRKLTFSTSFQDNTASPVYTQRLTDLEIDVDELLLPH